MDKCVFFDPSYETPRPLYTDDEELEDSGWYEEDDISSEYSPNNPWIDLGGEG